MLFIFAIISIYFISHIKNYVSLNTFWPRSICNVNVDVDNVPIIKADNAVNRGHYFGKDFDQEKYQMES